jgi:hypothetical protein
MQLLKGLTSAVELIDEAHAIGSREDPSQACPLRCIKESRRRRFRGLVKRVLLAGERLSETPPRVKSSRGDGTWYVTSLRWCYKPSVAASPGPLSRIYCNIRLKEMVFMWWAEQTLGEELKKRGWWEDDAMGNG